MKRLIGEVPYAGGASVPSSVMIGEYGIRLSMNHKICVKYFEIIVQKFAFL